MSTSRARARRGASVTTECVEFDTLCDSCGAQRSRMQRGLDQMKKWSGVIAVLGLIAAATVFACYRRYSLAAEVHAAADAGDTSKLKELITAHPTLLNVRDRWGMTPLYHAALYHRVATVRILLDAGADLEPKDNKAGKTALATARQRLDQYDKVFTPQYYQGHAEFLRAQGLNEEQIRAQIKRQRAPYTPRAKADWQKIVEMLEEAAAKHKRA